ncbi:MAG: hypothetical protein IPJ77_06025 [Planctomycetes bacterium]|nr:hypothetical protein [Planctomycetota bacterium]
MDLTAARAAVDRIEDELDRAPFVVAHVFERDERELALAFTARARRLCKRGRVWKSKALLTAVKNAGYGFDRKRALSPGGADGIFLLTRAHRPVNSMMQKLFTRYLDKEDSGARELAAALGVPVTELLPVRLVSHHLRLLGVLRNAEGRDTLVIVDYDDE